MNNYKIYPYLLFLFLLCSYRSSAQQRINLSLNSNWFFFKGEAKYPTLLERKNTWEKVQIPHSWNTVDVSDDQPGYYRGTGWYTRAISIPEQWKNKTIVLNFEGANQVAEVYINKKKVGTHIGGYTGFNLDITSYVYFGKEDNELTVKINNSHQPNIPPLSADFTFFGGLYRDVWLSAMDKTHFEIDEYGGKGVFITTPNVSESTASVRVKGNVASAERKPKEVTIIASVLDQGKVLLEEKQQIKFTNSHSFELNINNVKNPKLWSPDSPNLYQIVTTIKDTKTGEIIDQLNNSLGFRWFKFDANKGFFLNGKPLKLIGASRHQDFKGLGNAVPNELAVKDVQLLKDMGGNFLRVAHYPQDPVILQACDRLGILAAVEIPVVNAITETQSFAQNCKIMQTEMIRQNFNHPSVIIWAYMNEVLLRPPFVADSARNEVYLKNVAALAQELEDLTRKEDPSRYTMIPNHGNFNLYHRVGLTKIPMLVGWNLYQGWYTGKFEGFASFLDMHHQLLPDKPLLVTEYGADADNRIHSDQPVRFDKSVEYAIAYHQSYLKAMLERPFVAAAMAWNLADFNSEERMETDPHVNNKGLMTIDRHPKDTYFFYQANLLTAPFIKIGLSGRNLLGGAANDNNLFKQSLNVYSNEKSVTLTVNGKKVGTKTTQTGTATFSVELKNGKNSILATGGQDSLACQDYREINVELIPTLVKSSDLPFTKVNISVGDKRYFKDEESQQLWIPDQPYRPGSWGYIGGRIFKMADTARLSYGSNKDILGTSLDAVYQTQRVGLTGYQFDVPDGQYEMTLHFAELTSTTPTKVLAYDLGTKAPVKETMSSRLFNVEVNGIEVIHQLGNRNYLKAAEAYNSRVIVTVKNNNGIKLTFKAISGETILNGIQLTRIY